MKEIGDFLKKERIKKGWTQKELAVKAGVSQSSVHRNEQGKIGEIVILFKIARSLGYKLDVDIVPRSTKRFVIE